MGDGQGAGLKHSSSVGKATLAYLSDAEVRRILDTAGMPKLTPNTITDDEAPRAQLKEIRRTGYAIDDEEEDAEGIFCVGSGSTMSPAPVWRRSA